MVLGYMYVLKQIAEVEKKGTISFNEISGHLKISTEHLKGLLELMERLGHVEKITNNSSILSSSCSNSCQSCSSCRCLGKNPISVGTVYRLTEKGRMMCR